MIERYGIHKWLFGRLGRVGDALYLFVAGSLAITVSGLAAYAFGEPFLFPSLGPTVYLFFEKPLSASSSPRSTLLGHFVALIAGYGSLAAFGLLDAPNVLQTGVSPTRIGAATLSVGVTGALILLFKDSHPPAGATTLIVSLGLLAGRLWVLDTGRPLFRTPPLGPKLVAIDLETNEVAQTISFADSPAILNTTYLNDVRFDLRKGEAGLAFITDSSASGPNAIIVVDLSTGEAWRQLEGHPSVQPEPDFLPIVEGRALLRNPGDAPANYLNTGADGIAVTPDRLFYRALASRHLYSVPLDAIAERDIDPQALTNMVTDHGDLGFASDGLESDDAGRIYLTDYENGAVHRFTPDAPLTERWETILYTDQIIWPDTLDLMDGALYLTVNQLNRQPSYQNGEDLRRPPYVLFRTDVDAAPVQLR